MTMLRHMKIKILILNQFLIFKEYAWNIHLFINFNKHQIIFNVSFILVFERKFSFFNFLTRYLIGQNEVFMNK